MQTQAVDQNLAGQSEYDILSEEDIAAMMESEDPAAGATSDDERQKRMRFAFAETKRRAKAAEDKAKQKEQELEEYKKQSAQVQTTNQGNVSMGGVVNSLMMEAMQSLKVPEITEDNRRIVEMEAQRIYERKMNDIERSRSAEANAPAIITEELSKVSQLDDADRTEVANRLNAKYDVLRRIDKDVIRMEAAQYVGEKMMNGTANPQPSNADGGTSISAAVSAAKNGRSGIGVTPGRGSAQVEEKSATAAELATMKKLGLMDLKLFREAQKLKHKYSID